MFPQVGREMSVPAQDMRKRFQPETLKAYVCAFGVHSNHRFMWRVESHAGMVTHACAHVMSLFPP